jgi:predicted kinase
MPLEYLMTARRVFLVTGLPATGKTTLARALARALAAPLLSKDGVKEPLLDVLGGGDRGLSSRLSDASFAVLFALADEQLGLTDAVVLEGNFRPGEHESAVQALLARHMPLSCTQVLCRVPEPLRQERLLARAADGARHPGHRDATWVAQSQRHADAFLDVPGPRYIHDGGTADPAPACALIHSLANRQLV